MTKVAFAVSTAITLAACDSGVSGGGGSQVASDACSAVTVASNATSYSNSVAGLVDSDSAGQYQYSVVTQPTDGTIVMNASTGDYTYTPFGNTAGARGFKTRFTYGVLENGAQVDTAEVEIIYGTKRIMPLGDSITFGVTRFSGPTGDQPADEFAIGYRKELYDRLSSEGYTVDFVGPESAGQSANLSDADHAGTPGAKSTAMYGNTSTWLADPSRIANPLPENKVDTILLHAGTNDLFQNDPTATAVNGVTSLLAQLQNWGSNNNTPVSVLTALIIPPNDAAMTNGNLQALPPIVETFNTQLTSTVPATYNNASNANFKVHLVDHHTPFVTATDLTSIAIDTVGLHPTTAGYTKMADTWYSALIANNQLEKCD